mgnify:CR=1 FL=1
MAYQLCDSEYRFMQVVWDSAPVSSGELVELWCDLPEAFQTQLRKLENRG